MKPLADKETGETHAPENIAELIDELEKAEENRLTGDLEIQDFPRLLKILVFDSLYFHAIPAESEIQELHERLSCEKPEPTPPWRQEAWKSLLGTKLFDSIAAYNSGKASHFQKGLRQGALSCFAKVYANHLSSYPFNPTSREIADLFPILIDYKSFEQAIMSPGEQATLDYAKGLQRGIQLFASDTGEKLKKQFNHDYLVRMIEDSEVIEEMDTVEELHNYLRRKLGTKFPIPLESFKATCSKLKFVGFKRRSKTQS